MGKPSEENIVQRIVDICKTKGIPISKLEKDLGYGNGFLNPKKVSDLKAGRLIDILDYLGMSAEEFFGIGSQKLQETETALATIKKNHPEYYEYLMQGDKKTPATESDGLVKEPYMQWVDKDARLLMWFRSLPEEKQKAILFSQDAPEGLV